jgi:threonine 3-dehydrogenase
MEPVNVVATDIRHSSGTFSKGPFAYCDVTDKECIARLVVEHRITHIMHLATLLSAVGERNPQLALRVNNLGIQNVLEVAAAHNVSVSPSFRLAVHGCAIRSSGTSALFE